MLTNISEPALDEAVEEVSGAAAMRPLRGFIPCAPLRCKPLNLQYTGGVHRVPYIIGATVA